MISKSRKNKTVLQKIFSDLCYWTRWGNKDQIYPRCWNNSNMDEMYAAMECKTMDMRQGRIVTSKRRQTYEVSPRIVLAYHPERVSSSQHGGRRTQEDPGRSWGLRSWNWETQKTRLAKVHRKEAREQSFTERKARRSIDDLPQVLSWVVISTCVVKNHREGSEITRSSTHMAGRSACSLQVILETSWLTEPWVEHMKESCLTSGG